MRQRKKMKREAMLISVTHQVLQNGTEGILSRWEQSGDMYGLRIRQARTIKKSSGEDI